ncbi:MAG: protein translocase subunit SecD, partial [Candidatus Altarchaeaceae archaeon]
DPTLGMIFLNYSLIAGLLAIILVSIFITIRYKKFLFAIPIMLTCLSEVIIILGFASLVKWELDLLAVAGIIIAVGTGVDNQIVIIDEALKRREKKEVISIIERIKAAFFIIFTSGTTTIVAMIALLMIAAGMLKGFAFTTIVGILIGIFITRPAFAKIVEILLK